VSLFLLCFLRRFRVTLSFSVCIYLSFAARPVLHLPFVARFAFLDNLLLGGGSLINEDRADLFLLQERISYFLSVCGKKQDCWRSHRDGEAQETREMFAVNVSYYNRQGSHRSGAFVSDLLLLSVSYRFAQLKKEEERTLVQLQIRERRRRSAELLQQWNLYWILLVLKKIQQVLVSGS
jgi:hypothetical protein